ncbi:O-antigen ligase family protein [Pollutibacter soli]|uniref:O-antigen ligase family protein n=1 Tax=Pollutibacter soli TaxID=3034157 RepID=UPI003013827D
MKNSFLILLFLTALNVGSFELPSPLIYGADLMNCWLVYLCFRRWKKTPLPFRTILTSWILLGVYIGFLAMNSEYVKGIGTFMYSLRAVYPFGLMIFIYFLVDESQMKFYINYVHFLCVLGAGLTIAQSLHGTEGLFADGYFYNRGHSGGQNYEINAFLTRVTLPTYYITVIMFMYLVYEFIYKGADLLKSALLGLYVIVILIGFSRSSWLAISICIVFALFITMLIRREKFQKAVSYILLTVLCISVVLTFLDTPVVNTIKQTLGERIEEMFYDLEKKDGNLASRLSTIEFGMRLFQTSPWIGIDLNLVALYEMYQATDVGYLYALLTMGAIGLVLLCVWYLITIVVSYNQIFRSARKKDTDGIILSLLLLTNILLFIMIQQVNQFTFSTACLSITCGLFLKKFRTTS